jgi:gluconolactonase
MTTPDAPSSPASFLTHSPAFTRIIGPSPTITILASSPSGTKLYHEACIYDAPSHSIFITSNQIPLSSLPTNLTSTLPSDSPLIAAGKTIRLTRLYDADDPSAIRNEDITPPSLPFANGGVNYKSGILICAQGNLTHTGAEGIVYIPSLTPPYTPTPLISTFHGRPFNSVNDVIVHPTDGSIWFTDPPYGFHQGIRPAPSLPAHLYRHDPTTGSTRALLTGLSRPNGLCFSPDCSILYVTDTGAITGEAGKGIDQTGPSHIWAYDIDPRGPFLGNQRLFAYAPGLLPDGIKCDTLGNVYSGCMDGVEVWDPSGELIGVIRVEGGVANFCFGKEGAMYMLNETRVWKAQMGKGVKGALLGI